MATFAAMKRNILFRIIFLLVVFISFGKAAYPNFNQQPFNVEQSMSVDNHTKSFSSHNESITEDFIDQPYKYIFTEEAKCQLPNSLNCSKIYGFCLSIWQPPKFF
jgi:hypothetical protein